MSEKIDQDDVNRIFAEKLTSLDAEELDKTAQLAAAHIKQLMGQPSVMSPVLPIRPAAFFGAVINGLTVELLIPKPEQYTVVVTELERSDDRDDVRKFTCYLHSRSSAYACFFQAVRSLAYKTHFAQRPELADEL